MTLTPCGIIRVFAASILLHKLSYATWRCPWSDLTSSQNIMSLDFFTFFGKTTNSIRPRHYCRSAFLRNPCCWLSVPPQFLSGFDFVQYQWIFFFSVLSTIFQIFPSIGDKFFVYLQTPLFRENLRPILPPRLYYFQYCHPFNILELLSIPELCISILSF